MTPEDREFVVELRRHLVGIVGLLERYASIDPSPPRWCAGCKRCEDLNRQQRDAYFATKRIPQQSANGSRN